MLKRELSWRTPLSGFFVWFIIGLMTSGCNRAALRLYGVGDSFPPAVTHFSSKVQHPYPVFIDWPEDKTAEYYGHSIAGTSWQGTRTDTFEKNTMRNLIYKELQRELQSAKVFTGISNDKMESDLTVETEIRAFGAQVRGFIWSRVGGVASLKFVLKQGDRVLFEKVYEKVVTDGDPEYTGSSVGFIEDGMRAAMSDSLREVLNAFLRDLEQLNTPSLPNRSGAEKV